MTQTKATTIDIGTVDARELIFGQPDDTRRYVLQAPGVEEDYLDFIGRYAAYDVKRTSHYYIDDTEGQWFAFYNVDCFDPPLAIIRARSFESAYEVFCNEFEHWLKVNETDLADYPEEERNYNDNGTYIDTDNVQGHELHLLSILL